MNQLIPQEKQLYLPYTQRMVSMIDFNASEVFASLLSCPTPNQDANYSFDKAKDPFVAPHISSDAGDIHTGCCYRKTYEALIKNNLNTPNTIIGHYTPHFHSADNRHPTLFLVDVNSVASPIFGIEDTPTFGEEKAPRRKRLHLFLIRRNNEWPCAWDSLINGCHHALEDDEDNDTWFKG